MKYLITGGAGFIGSNLAIELKREDHEIIVIDNLSVTKDNLKYFDDDIIFVKEDITNLEEIKPYFEGVDVVVHLAAMNRAPRSIEDPLGANEVNITGTLNVLESMRAHGVKRIIFASSSSVYAGRNVLLEEDMKLSPPHPYGVGKLAGEHYCRIYGELYDLEPTVLRFFSIYGPHQSGTIKHGAVIPKFIHNIVNKKDITIYGLGEQQRNFTYIDDCIQSIILASQNKESIGEIINVANPNEKTISEVVKVIEEVVGVKSTKILQHRLKGDPFRNPASTKKAERILNYVPEVDLEEGIKKTYNWYKNENRN